ncbi:hypothetical protein GGX14DRAFT_565348 [Mycena pura]|nr:hypothetical protein GGX14DRAFT_565348 [Mycena pura]
MEKEAQEMIQQREKEREEMRREAEKRQAEYDTKMAAFHSRRIGGRPEPDDREDGIPERVPQYVSDTTREQRRIEVILRDREGERFPPVSMTAPTQPTPSSSEAPHEEPEPEPSSSSTPDMLAALENPLIQQRIMEMVGEKLKAKSKGKRKKGRVGSMAALNKAREEQKDALTHEQDLRWKTLVREKYRSATGHIRGKDFFNYEGVAAATVKRCDEGDPSAQPRGSNEKLYFGEGWASALWNRIIFEKCIDEMLTKRAEDPGKWEVPDVSTEYLMALFINCIKLGRAEWRRNQPNAGETFMQARERAKEYDAERSEKRVATSRKNAKFETRVRTSKRMMEVSLAKNDHTSADTWKWFKDDFLPELDKGGMSSEEDEPAEVVVGNERTVQTVHGIKICPWRAPKITSYMKMIDEAGDNVSLKLSNKRPRIRGRTESKAEPPHGLPRAMYNEDWLAQRKPYIPDIEKELEIKEKPFTLMDIEVVN